MVTFVGSPSSVIAAGNWASVASVFASDDVRATVGTAGTEQFQVGFDFFFDIPDGSTILSVQLGIEHHESATTTTLQGEVFVGNNSLSGLLTFTTTTSVDTLQRVALATAPTLADIRSSILSAVVTGAKSGGGGSRTLNIDHVHLVVNYEPPVQKTSRDYTANIEALEFGFDEAVGRHGQLLDPPWRALVGRPSNVTYTDFGGLGQVSAPSPPSSVVAQYRCLDADVDGEIEVTWKFVSSDPQGIFWRGEEFSTSSIPTWSVNSSGNVSRLTGPQDGVSMGSIGAMTAEDRIKVSFIGGTHTIFRNGTQVAQFTGWPGVGKLVGLTTSTPATRLDDFAFRPIPGWSDGRGVVEGQTVVELATLRASSDIFTAVEDQSLEIQGAPVTVELWESGVFRATLFEGTVSRSDVSNLDLSFDASLIIDKSGAGVEVRIYGGNSTDSLNIDSVAWDSQVLASDAVQKLSSDSALATDVHSLLANQLENDVASGDDQISIFLNGEMVNLTSSDTAAATEAQVLVMSEVLLVSADSSVTVEAEVGTAALASSDTLTGMDAQNRVAMYLQSDTLVALEAHLLDKTLLQTDVATFTEFQSVLKPPKGFIDTRPRTLVGRASFDLQ